MLSEKKKQFFDNQKYILGQKINNIFMMWFYIFTFDHPTSIMWKVSDSILVTKFKFCPASHFKACVRAVVNGEFKFGFRY